MLLYQAAQRSLLEPLLSLINAASMTVNNQPMSTSKEGSNCHIYINCVLALQNWFTLCCYNGTLLEMAPICQYTLADIHKKQDAKTKK